MKAMITTIAAVAALTIGSTAVAGPSWTYADLGFVVGDSSQKDQETEGAALRGSFGFGSMWHVQALVAAGEENGGKSSSANGSDVVSYGIRGGIHPSITDNTDFVLDLGYMNTENEFGFGTGNTATKEDNDTVDIRTGVRSNIGPVELRSFVSLGFFDGDASNVEGRDIVFQVGGQYNFTEAWSVGADAILGDNGDVIDLYVRWSF